MEIELAWEKIFNNVEICLIIIKQCKICDIIWWKVLLVDPGKREVVTFWR